MIPSRRTAPEVLHSASLITKVDTDQNNAGALAVMQELQILSDELPDGPVIKQLDDEYARIGKLCFNYEQQRYTG